MAYGVWIGGKKSGEKSRYLLQCLDINGAGAQVLHDGAERSTCPQPTTTTRPRLDQKNYTSFLCVFCLDRTVLEAFPKVLDVDNATQLLLRPVLFTRPNTQQKHTTS